MQPRESDILIVTSPKAGTTLMQQMVHQLRTGGDDAFDEIGEVVPWIELAHDLGQDIHGEHRFSPRVFKTHAWFHSLNPGGKRIVVLRHPTDVAVSFYHFFANVRSAAHCFRLGCHLLLLLRLLRKCLLG